MTFVPRVLLNQVDIYPAQVHLAFRTRVDKHLVEVPIACWCPSEIAFTEKGREDLLWISIGSVVEGAAGICFAAIQPADVLISESNAKPDTLDVGHMPHKPK